MTCHIFGSLLLHIAASVPDVMECIRHLTLEADRDLADGILLPPFIKFMEADSSRPREALNIVLNDIDDTFDFVAPVIIAGSKFELSQYTAKAIELTRHSDIRIRIRATHALGRIDYVGDSSLINRSVQAIKSVIKQNFDETLFASALYASYSLYNQDHNAEDAVVQIFQLILEHKNDYILRAASEILFRNQ